MLIALYDRANRATWWHGIILLIFFVACVGGLDWREKWQEQKLGRAVTLLDVRFRYAAAEVHELFKELGAQGRQIYAATELTLDLVFPLTYGAILVICLARLSGREIGRYLVIFPAVTVVADLLENLAVVCLLWSYQEQTSSRLWSALAWTGAKFTATKWVFALASVLTVLVTAIVAARKFVTYGYLLQIPLLIALAMVVYLLAKITSFV
jgi:hypothetical protein